MDHGHQSIPDEERHAEGERAPNQGATFANHQPYVPNPLHQPVPSSPTPNNQGGVPSRTGSRNILISYPSDCWDYSYSLAPHKLGGHMPYQTSYMSFPGPGPIQYGGFAALSHQLPIWNIADMPMDVLVQDLGEHGFYLTAVDQVVCLIFKRMVADLDKNLSSLRNHFGQNVDLFLNRIIPCFREIPPEEKRRLIRHFFPIREVSYSCFVPGPPNLEGPNVPDRFILPAHGRAYLPAHNPVYPFNYDALLGSISIPHGHPYPIALLPSYPSAYPSAHPPVQMSGQPITGPNSSAGVPPYHSIGLPVGSLPSSSAAMTSGRFNTPISGAGPCYTAVPTPTSSLSAVPPPPARARRRRAKKKVAEIQWNNEQSAFVVYYLGNGYLLSQVQRMFSTEFEGTAPTIKDIRQQLEVIDNNDAEALTRYDLSGEVAQGRIRFKAQREKVPVPSPRSEVEEVETPLGPEHKKFTIFLKEIGLDSALAHELFELHFEGTITEEQLEEMWKKPVGGKRHKRILTQAYRDGWFKYVEEGQIGYVDCSEVRRNISRALAKARIFMKKESISKVFREVEGREKGEAADENADDSDKREAEESEQDEEWETEEGSEDIVADSIQREPQGGITKRPSVRDKRPRKDRERSSSPK